MCAVTSFLSHTLQPMTTEYSPRPLHNSLYFNCILSWIVKFERPFLNWILVQTFW
uniref:Uncharacterized protein n=1 Tax=Anguilla anguilla TaxID=7936 RepID=A0A0E9PY51_ANGAN